VTDAGSTPRPSRHPSPPPSPRVDVEVGKHLRDVVHLLEAFDELQQPLGVAASTLTVFLEHRDFGALHRHFSRAGLVDGMELRRGRRDE